MSTFEGIVKGNVIDVRFALSGKVLRVSARTGDIVKKWDLIASLDRKILQTELDRQLADFEKVRAVLKYLTRKTQTHKRSLINI